VCGVDILRRHARRYQLGSSHQARRRARRVLAGFFAAADRSALPLVRDACLAAAERCEMLVPAAACARAESERLETDSRGSRFSARLVAALRRALVRLELPSP